MVDTNYQNMVDEIKANIGADEEPGVIEFYERHKNVIWEMLREDAEDMGYSNPMEMVVTFNRSDMLGDEDSFKNLLAWYALETVCRRLVDEGEHLADEDEEDEDPHGLYG